MRRRSGAGNVHRMAASADQRVSDLVLCAAVTGLAVADALGFKVPDHYVTPTGPFDVALALTASLPIAVRHRFPVAVLAIVEAATALRIVLDGGLLGIGALGLLVAVFTVATQLDRTHSLRLTGRVVVTNVLAFVAVLFIGHTDAVRNGIFFATSVAGSWALGDNLGTRRAYLAALVERARHLEGEQEARAQRAVLGERTRIARELHDVIAHHVSAIAVQAGAAEEIAERNPRRAQAALRSIQGASRQALAEMRAIVGILRDSEDRECLAPQPTMAQVRRLAKQIGGAGLEVEVRVEGVIRPLPELVELSAYRIVQEALTNTLRHTSATRATVTILYGATVLDVVVCNDGVVPSGALSAPGRGLVGMRERVALFHGRLEVGPSPEGGFRVHAHLPLEEVGQ